MYLWRSWESNKRDMGAGSGRDGLTAIEAAAEALYHPNPLIDNRRKSVSFAVVRPVQDGDNISFDITHRSVTLGVGGSVGGSSNTLAPSTSSPTPSAPGLIADGRRRDSLEQLRPEKPYRRLSLAPEDALFPPSFCAAFNKSCSFMEEDEDSLSTAFPFPPVKSKSDRDS